MIINKKARHNYEIKDTLVAGLVLNGQEVKTLRTGHGSLKDAYIKIMDGQAWLINADLPRYSHSSDPNYDSRRRRKLLLHKKEILSLQKKMEKTNLTLIPLKIFFKHRWAKIEIALAKGRKAYQKKERKKRQDLDREIARTLKQLAISS